MSVVGLKSHKQAKAFFNKWKNDKARPFSNAITVLWRQTWLCVTNSNLERTKKHSREGAFAIFACFAVTVGSS